jgi:hypothetical protein
MRIQICIGIIYSKGTPYGVLDNWSLELCQAYTKKVLVLSLIHSQTNHGNYIARTLAGPYRTRYNMPHMVFFFFLKKIRYVQAIQPIRSTPNINTVPK